MGAFGVLVDGLAVSNGFVAFAPAAPAAAALPAAAAPAEGAANIGPTSFNFCELTMSSIFNYVSLQTRQSL